MKVHVHVYMVSAMVEIDVTDAKDEEDARQRAVNAVSQKTEEIHLKPSDCHVLAVSFVGDDNE